MQLETEQLKLNNMYNDNRIEAHIENVFNNSY